MPGGSTLEHLNAGPGPFALVVTSTADVGAGVGVEARSGFMRSVRSMTLVEDEEALWHAALPGLGSSPAGPWVLRSPGAPAWSGAGKPKRAGGAAPGPPGPA